MRFYSVLIWIWTEDLEREECLRYLSCLPHPTPVFFSLVELLGSFRFICKTQAALELTFKACEPALINVINHR